MVKAYMDEHPDVTFAQLFALNDEKAVLNEYKPR